MSPNVGSFDRDPSYDIVRGALVVVMTAYHVMSIAVVTGEEHFRYLRFVSGSFIFMSGYILALFSQARFADKAGATAARLLVRGLKILLIFSVLNVLIQVTGVGNVAKERLGLEGLLERAGSIYLGAAGPTASFLILLPIAYLLMISPALLWLNSPSRKPVVVLVLLASLAAASISWLTRLSPIIEFMLVGIAGLSCGQLASGSGAPHRSRLRSLWIAMPALVLSVWLAGQIGYLSVALYTVGVALVLAALFEVAAITPAGGVPGSWLVLLGRYSLFAYIAQIVLIQLGFQATGGRRWPFGLEAAAAFALTVSVLVVCCLILERWRSRSQLVDRVYRLAFS